MKRKQSLTKMQLYQIIKEAQNTLLETAQNVATINQNVQNIITTSNTNPEEILQNVPPLPVKNLMNQYVNALIQKKKRNKDITSKEATPLNSNWNSLSLGTEMYDSIFSFQVDTPQVWYDPLTWNIIHAALPHDFSIPDSKFVKILRTTIDTDSK